MGTHAAKLAGTEDPDWARKPLPRGAFGQQNAQSLRRAGEELPPPPVSRARGTARVPKEGENHAQPGGRLTRKTGGGGGAHKPTPLPPVRNRSTHSTAAADQALNNHRILGCPATQPIELSRTFRDDSPPLPTLPPSPPPFTPTTRLTTALFVSISSVVMSKVSTQKEDLFRADGVRITHDPYHPAMVEKYGMPGNTDNEGFDPYADSVGAGIYGGIVKRDASGNVVIGRQYQNHNPEPGPVYAGGGYTPMSEALQSIDKTRALLDKFPELANEITTGGATPLHMCGMYVPCLPRPLASPLLPTKSKAHLTPLTPLTPFNPLLRSLRAQVPEEPAQHRPPH